jgi:hypothetical protein
MIKTNLYRETQKLLKQQARLEAYESLIERYELDTKRYPGMKEYHQDPMAMYRLLKMFQKNMKKWIEFQKKMIQKEKEEA